jgi:hypothetical protein
MIRAFMLAALLLSTGAQAAAVRIGFDAGGSILEYIQRYEALQASGDTVIIDGMCISACTLVTGLVDPDRVCVTHRARLAFHSATINDQHSVEGTRLIWYIYPPIVRAMLAALGWDGSDAEHNEHINLIYIEGDELARIYRACGPEIT